MSISKSKMKCPECDGCLWNSTQPAKLTNASFASSTCLHCFCMQCMRALAQQSSSNKRESGKTRWFRCPVATCGIMIQANQIRELSAKNQPLALQYLLKSYNVTKAVTTAQKACQFHIENYKGHIKLQQLEMDRKMKLVNKIEAKLASVEKKYNELKESHQLLQQKVSNPIHCDFDIESESNVGNRQPLWNDEAGPGLSFLGKGADATMEKSLLF